MRRYDNSYNVPPPMFQQQQRFAFDDSVQHAYQNSFYCTGSSAQAHFQLDPYLASFDMSICSTPPFIFNGYDPSDPRCFRRRVSANRKERRRTQSINNAFSHLRSCIPNVPSDTKLSKIKTLRLATKYIEYLMDLLAKGEEISERALAEFKAEVSRTRKSTSAIGAENCGKKSKGRTGWPHDLWANDFEISNNENKQL